MFVKVEKYLKTGNLELKIYVDEYLMLNCRTSKSVTAFPQAFEICQITLKFPTPFVYRPIYLKSQTKSRCTMLHFWRFAFFPHKNKTLWLQTFLLWQCFFCLFLWLSEENCLKNCLSFILGDLTNLSALVNLWLWRLVKHFDFIESYFESVMKIDSKIWRIKTESLEKWRFG